MANRPRIWRSTGNEALYRAPECIRVHFEPCWSTYRKCAALTAHRIQHLKHMRNTLVRFRHGFQAVPYLTALGNEIVVRIDQQNGGDLLVKDHCRSPLLVRVKNVIFCLHCHMACMPAVVGTRIGSERVRFGVKVEQGISPSAALW